MIALKGFSINRFAEEINASPSYLKNVLNGKKKPYPNFAKKIADGLGVSIPDIFFASSGRKSVTK